MAALDVSVVMDQLTISGATLLDDISEKLQDQTFRVLIAGEFNAGKSFFINTMLDGWRQETDPITRKAKWQGLLGVDIVPATTLLTELRSGPFESAHIRLRDGRSIPLSIRDVPAFTDLARFGRGSTAHMQNASIFEPLAQRLQLPLESLANVGPECSHVISEWLYETFDRAVVNVDAGLLKDGIVLIDSPGLGAVFHEHEKITENEMRRADSIVFLIASTNPLTERAVNFLQASRAFIDNFFFVQTKTDQVVPEELSLLVDRNCQILGRVLGCEVNRLRYHLVSAQRYRNAQLAGDAEAMIGSGFPALAKDLGAFLVEERGTPTLRLETEVVARVVTQAKRQILESQALMLSTAADLEQRAVAARDNRAAAATAGRRAVSIIDDACNTVLNDVDGRLLTLRDEFALIVGRMERTGGLLKAFTGIDDEISMALTARASAFAEDVVQRDVMSAATKLLRELSSMNVADMPAVVQHLRLTLTAVHIKTSPADKAKRNHVAKYEQAAAQYKRKIGVELDAQIRAYFAAFVRTINDRFSTKDAELAQRQETIERYRENQTAMISEDQDRISALAGEIHDIDSVLSEVQSAIDAVAV